MKNNKFNAILMILLSAVFAVAQSDEKQAENLQPPAGGQFAITKSAIAGGGREMQQNSTAIHGTAGQAVAGGRSTGGQFQVYSGFWTPETLAPTAAQVSVGGRVSTSDGRGIRNVHVTLTFPGGESRSVLTGAFGNYRFAEIPVGETYIFRVSAKRYSFEHDTQVRTIYEETDDVNFIARGDNSSAGNSKP